MPVSRAAGPKLPTARLPRPVLKPCEQYHKHFSQSNTPEYQILPSFSYLRPKRIRPTQPYQIGRSATANIARPRQLSDMPGFARAASAPKTVDSVRTNGATL